MQIPSRDFFTNEEVLFIGYSRNPKSFSQKVYQTFVNAGIKVYPVNINKSSDFAVKVFNSLDELKNVPETAYVLLNKQKTRDVVDILKNKGIKKILFQNTKTVEEETIKKCKELGLDAQIACPMMILSKGFIHRFHGWVEGKKK